MRTDSALEKATVPRDGPDANSAKANSFGFARRVLKRTNAGSTAISAGRSTWRTRKARRRMEKSGSSARSVASGCTPIARSTTASKTYLRFLRPRKVTSIITALDAAPRNSTQIQRSIYNQLLPVT